MSHEANSSPDIDGNDRVSSRLCCRSQWPDVHVSGNGTVAARLDAVVADVCLRGVPPASDWRYWLHRDSDLRNTGHFHKFEIEARTAFAVRVVIARMERALDMESYRVKTNHWASCVARQNACLTILRNERRLLQQFEAEGL